MFQTWSALYCLFCKVLNFGKILDIIEEIINLEVWGVFCYSCSINDSFLHIWSSFERMKAKNIQRSHLHRLIFLSGVSHVVPCVVTSVNLYLAFLVFRGQGLCMWLCLVYINLIYKRQNKSKFLISLVNMQQYISCTYFKLFSIWKLL